MRLILFSLSSILLSFSLQAEEPIRTWTSSDGRTLEARFIEQAESNVKIKNKAGQEFTLPITRFSPADQKYVVEAAARAFFKVPGPFDDKGKGGLIIASTIGKVEVITAPRYGRSQEVEPVARDAIVGEPLPHGTTILTGANSEADLLLTNGSIAKVGPDSKLVLSAFWQKDFRASAKKVNDLKEETSPSRVAFKLETGELVVEVKKLNRQSSFMVESRLGFAGIRGTKFGLSVDSQSTELVVLEGQVTFRDSKEQTKNLESSQMVTGTPDGAGEINALPESEKSELVNTVTELQKSALQYDLTRLANTVDGYATKPNYIVESALNMELIWCTPGSFIMGEKISANQEHPVVLTNGFYLGKFEVTQEEYEKVMGNNPSTYKAKKLPVETVSWDEAINFCKRLNQREPHPSGWKFSLPTEAQWEYACRAGTTTQYSWGDQITPDQANSKDNGLGKPKVIGSYPSNPWGFHDLHGNVNEWCSDWYGDYPEGLSTDPIGPNTGKERVMRSGNFLADRTALRSAMRAGLPPDKPQVINGFRLCLAPVP